jgi:catechol 2,3-dioxygenase-like lactoylglutathione lyase family enzyme
MATTAESARAAIEFGGVTPVLRVRDLAVSIDYYTRVLGFKINWGYPESGEAFFASVSRGKCCLFLSVGDQGHPGSWVWLDGKDVDAVYEEFKAAGAKIRPPPPPNDWWALEMQVEDPDGNVLRIGSDPRPGEPYGDWLDMYGDRWGRTADGQPVRVEVK